MSLLIIHDYRTGIEVGIKPEDIRYVEGKDHYSVIVHLVPLVVPPGPNRPPSMFIMPKETEVMESIDEIQRMDIELKQLEQGDFTKKFRPVVITAHRDLAVTLRNPSFGNGPRQEETE